MKKTLKVSSANIRHVKQESLACQVICQSRKPLGSGQELDALLPSIFDKVFKGEL